MIFKVMRNIFAGVTFVVRHIFLKISCILQLYILCSAVGLPWLCLLQNDLPFNISDDLLDYMPKIYENYSIF